MVTYIREIMSFKEDLIRNTAFLSRFVLSAEAYVHQS